MTFKEFKEQYKKLMNDEERNAFINHRIKELLSQTNEVDKIGMGICGSYDKFISPKTSIYSNETPFFSALTLDDMDVYKEFMNFINNDIDTFLWSEPYTIYVIQNFIWYYFGYNAGDPLARMDIYIDNPNEKLSIKQLRGNNIAACSERSALVQNILQFLGFESELVFGKLVFGKLNESKTSPHAYIIFKAGNKTTRILYDPMNPIVYIKDEKKCYDPGVCLLSEEDYENLKNGQSITFDYSLSKRIFAKNCPCFEAERRYTCDNFTKNNEYVITNTDENSKKSR